MPPVWGLNFLFPCMRGGRFVPRVREAKYKANESYMLILEAQRTARAEADARVGRMDSGPVRTYPRERCR
jgi:hypothetical protein